MLGKTHMVCGMASVLAIMQPKNIPEFALAVGTGAVGALISDIDVGTSESHQEADRITVLAIGVIVFVFALDYFFHTGIMETIIKDSSYVRIVSGIFLFIFICAFGKEQPHRSFMHSFLALFLLSCAIALVWQPVVPYFAIGFLSHLILDCFNKKKVGLLYPYKKGVCFGVCKASGIVNRVLFIVGSVVLVIQSVQFFLRVIIK